MPFGCSVKGIDHPGVVVYKVCTDAKSRCEGAIASLTLVPEDFTLE